MDERQYTYWRGAYMEFIFSIDIDTSSVLTLIASHFVANRSAAFRITAHEWFITCNEPSFQLSFITYRPLHFLNGERHICSEFPYCLTWMSDTYIRTSFVSRHVRRWFRHCLGANVFGPSYVSCLYLKQIVGKSKDNTRLTSVTASCTPYSGKRDCFREKINEFHHFARMVAWVYIQHRYAGVCARKYQSFDLAQESTLFCYMSNVIKGFIP